VVLFECLAGHRPFAAESPVAIALAHVRAPVPELPDHVPAGLVDVVHRAMAKRPEDRYADGAELAAALHALAAEPTIMLTAPVPAIPPTAPPPEGFGPLAGRRTALWVLAGMLVAAVVLIGGVVALSSMSDGGTDAPTTDSSPSASPSAPRTVTIDPAAYVGKPVADVRTALRGLGLPSRVTTVHNPGGHTAGTVAALRPTGAVTAGTTVAIDAWGAAPKPAATTGGTQHHGGKPAKGKGKGKH
jgi:serine/threonine-protein kinase